jgi:hypothetical protein
MIDIDLSKPPDGPGASGYDELYTQWKRLGDVFAAGRTLNQQDFLTLGATVRKHLTGRERQFFDEPFEPEVRANPDHVQAKTTAQLHKILMDRHGFRVAKDKGGLG